MYLSTIGAYQKHRMWPDVREGVPRYRRKNFYFIE